MWNRRSVYVLFYLISLPRASHDMRRAGTKALADAHSSCDWLGQVVYKLNRTSKCGCKMPTPVLRHYQKPVLNICDKVLSSFKVVGTVTQKLNICLLKQCTVIIDAIESIRNENKLMLGGLFRPLAFYFVVHRGWSDIIQICCYPTKYGRD